MDTKNAIKLNEITFQYIIESRVLRKLMSNIITPDVQRAIDNEHVDEILQYQKAFFLKHNCYDFSQPIILAEYGKKYVLLDGGHRLNCIMKLEGAFKVVLIIYKNLNTIKDIEEKLKAINKNKPILFHIDDPNYAKINELNKKMHEKWNSCHSKAASPKIPNFNIDKFSKKFHMFEIDSVIKSIELLNAEALNKEQAFKKKFDGGSILAEENQFLKNIQKCHTKKCYIRLFPNYETILKHIIEKKEWKTLCGITTTRKKFTAKEREKFFKKEFGLNPTGNCFSCNSVITMQNYHCGHIDALAAGGSNADNNIKPVCAKCNLKMGTKNMHKYKNKLEKDDFVLL